MSKEVIGDRIECDGAKGTIKWIGNIPSFSGIWYGIDWDDENRGKHNGSHKGVHYFDTRYEKSGSFVRPSKVNRGMSLEEAVRGRYQDNFEIEEVLSCLQTVVLDGWLVADGGNTDLSNLLPRIQDLDVSNTLLSSWECVAHITKQLPRLKFLNVSGNLLELPANTNDLVQSTQHVTHVVLNKMLTYSWQNLMECAKLFPNVRKIQFAYNNLEALGPIPAGVFESLEDIDVGVNPLEDWDQICHLGKLPRLQIMNLNSCKLQKIYFKDAPPGGKTTLFCSLTSIMLANNPLSTWESVGELDKLKSLDELILSQEEVEGRGNFFMDYTFGRLRNLKMLNRTVVTPRMKRDHQLFYLRSFSNDYYSSGGCENPENALLSPEFVKKHPSYLSIVRLLGAPPDERGHDTQKSQKLRDLKVDLRIVPTREGFTECVKSFLPATRISKIKMMIKRMFKIDTGTKVFLHYCPAENAHVNFEIKLDNDMQDVQFFSMHSGDTIKVSW